MRKRILFLLSVFIYLNLTAQEGRKIISMDENWLFKLGTIPESIEPSFSDSDWRKVNVPHDWSIEGKYNKYNKSGRGGGYLPTGDGWYRKTFTIPESEKSSKIFIEFDGIMANSEVYVNGYLLGKWPYGYTSLIYEMTDHLNYGDDQSNVLTVRANNIEQPASRWYTGAGIYRHVRMIIKNPVHLAHWGVFVTTPEVSSIKAKINANIELENTSGISKSISIQSTIIDKNGKEIKSSSSPQKIAANSSFNFNQVLEIDKPLLWDIEDPNLYNIVVKVKEGNTLLDEETTTFGIRNIRYNAEKGFFLNDKHLKMFGVCMHHDGGSVGAAVPLGVWEYRFNKLKEAGINAIRTAHNPMAPEFYDLCDRMGILVMNETFDTWEYAKSPYDYHLFFNDWWDKDTRAMVMRDRNHPSIVLYGVGNEIRDNLNNEDGFRKYKQQQDLIHELDPTRPVTMALFRPNSSNVYDNGFADMMDVVGQNYRSSELLAAHAQNPERIVIGIENGQDLETYLALRDNDFMCGQFLWPGFDYLGEALWPKISFDAGLFDKAGGWKRNGLLRRTWWSEKPAVFVLRRADNSGVGDWMHDWSPIDPLSYDEAYLEIFCNAEEVELFLNDKSLGVRKVPSTRQPIKMNVNFRKGTLRAEARTKGKKVAEDILKTSDMPYKIILTPHKESISNDGENVVYVKATIVDENSIRCPDADHLVVFEIEGSGDIIATENGDAQNHENSFLKERTTYLGECFAIVMANKNAGKLNITAKAEGLEGVAQLEILIE